MSRYPVGVLRIAFPTIGRSDGVMTGVRDQLTKLLRGRRGEAADEAAVFDPDPNAVPTERVSDWSAGRRERRMVLARAACGGRHAFSALKRVALERLIGAASRQGLTTAVVLPMSPYYQSEFFDPVVSRKFEEALTDLQLAYPDVRWIRLDGLGSLRDNDMFWDFVHLNRAGQRIATEAFLAELDAERERP